MIVIFTDKQNRNPPILRPTEPIDEIPIIGPKSTRFFNVEELMKFQSYVEPGTFIFWYWPSTVIKGK